MTFSLLQLQGMPIFEQLQIEEALLRADEGNWCIVNTQAPPAIVMGISGKPEKLLHVERVKADNIPVIKRFSGGGTVYIDPQTLFITFICNAKDVGVAPFPHTILEWSERLYRPLFPGFSLRENDYVFGERKFGGNAQYIRKDRWLHHTSFLWDFDIEKMHYLKLPEKRPKYRQDRSHDAFLCRLKDHLKEARLEDLLQALMRNLPHSKVVVPQDLLARPHRKSLTLLSL